MVAHLQTKQYNILILCFLYYNTTCNPLVHYINKMVKSTILLWQCVMSCYEGNDVDSFCSLLFFPPTIYRAAARLQEASQLSSSFNHLIDSKPLLINNKNKRNTMAPSSPLRSKAPFHGRSLSLPSASHPSISQFNDTLSKDRSSEATCSSLSSTNSRINGLRNLYESIDDLLVLPHIQQIISEECVDDCINLLDACSSVKDLISLVKEDVRELLSALRRKDVNGINNYLSSRRNSKKMIQKAMKNMRRSASASSENVSEEMSVVYMLKEADSVAFTLLESLLSYTMGMKKSSSRSLVSKLMHSNKASDNENEFNKLDSLLKANQEMEVVNHLKEMDSSIQVLEEDLESVFRQLIKTRVSLLNILNH